MRHGLVPGSLTVLAALVLVVAVLPSWAETLRPTPALVLAADARALRYGATGPEMFENAHLRDKLRGLFGADWSPGPQRTFGASAYFPASATIRMLRVGELDYIAISGCVTDACTGHHGLLLVGPDEQLLARLDDGGFSHYYYYGSAAPGDAITRSAVDGAWLAIKDVERG
jgi:hypothetical protein